MRAAPKLHKRFSVQNRENEKESGTRSKSAVFLLKKGYMEFPLQPRASLNAWSSLETGLLTWTEAPV